MDEIERHVGPMIDMDKLEITNEVYNDLETITDSDIQDVFLPRRQCTPRR